MAGFEEILGQDKLVEHFKNAIKLNKISHAYILNGEVGMGKKMMAGVFSMTVECEKGGLEPCMQCHSCRQCLSGNHPDIKWVTHEKPQSISVEDIRIQLNQDIVIKPYQCRKKIYIVDEAEKMTVASQNALLKTIEEPPEYAVILLLTSNKQMLLQTILSRCVVMDMQPVKNDVIVEYLKKKERIVDYRAREAAGFCGGNIGRARELCSSDDFFSFKEEVIRMTKNVMHATAADLNENIKNILKEYKDNLGMYFNLVELWYRDVLIYKASGSERELFFQKEAADIRSQAESLEYHSLEKILSGIEKIRFQLKSNVNAEVAMEMFFIQVRDLFSL